MVCRICQAMRRLDMDVYPRGMIGFLYLTEVGYSNRLFTTHLGCRRCSGKNALRLSPIVLYLQNVIEGSARHFFPKHPWSDSQHTYIYIGWSELIQMTDFVLINMTYH